MSVWISASLQLTMKPKTRVYNQNTCFALMTVEDIFHKLISQTFHFSFPSFLPPFHFISEHYRMIFLGTLFCLCEICIYGFLYIQLWPSKSLPWFNYLRFKIHITILNPKKSCMKKYHKSLTQHFRDYQNLLLLNSH